MKKLGDESGRRVLTCQALVSSLYNRCQMCLFDVETDLSVRAEKKKKRQIGVKMPLAAENG